MNSRKRERGFTLLELLVAMTVLSLIAVVMFGGLKFSAQVWDRSSQANDDAEAVEVVQNLLRHQLSSIYPRWLEKEGYVAFEGHSQGIEFVGPLPAQFGPGPYHEFHLFLTPDQALNLNWDGEQPAAAPILEHIASVRFSYFGSAIGTTTSVWTNDWVNRPHLPQLIRIQISFGPDDRRVWPELIVHPNVTTDVACIYEPISHGCRGRPG